jgi:hypothetical protein
MIADVTENNRAEWLAERNNSVGASEAAAALGVCSYQSPIELWQKKCGLAPPVVENEAMQWGLALEPVIAAEYERRTGRAVGRRQQFVRHPVLRACSQAGLVNNLNDALAWGLVPLYLAAHGAGATKIGIVAAVYPGVWGLLQIGTGWFSDHVGRKPLIAIGMLVQAAALALLVPGGGAFTPALAAAALLGLGTALVYPTLIAAVSDVVEPRDRAAVVGIYRFWRDTGFVAGALLAGFVADVLSSGGAILIVSALTAASGLIVAATPWPADDD